MTSATYATYIDADTFFSEYPSTVTATWTALSNANKTAYLLMATKAIDKNSFFGFKKFSTQELQFPRKYFIDPNHESPWGLQLTIDQYGYYTESDVPTCVEEACYWEALELAEYYVDSDDIDEHDLIGKGVTSFSLGKLSMSFSGKSDASRVGMRSQKAYDLISKYIENGGFLI